jgi:hypothetical protein
MSKQRYVVLKEQSSGPLLQSLLVAKLVKEKGESITIKEALRFCESVKMVPTTDRIGKPDGNYTYILEKFQFPDTVLSYEEVDLELSKFTYCVEVDESHELVAIFEKAWTQIRAAQAGLVTASQDKIVNPITKQ